MPSRLKPLPPAAARRTALLAAVLAIAGASLEPLSAAGATHAISLAATHPPARLERDLLPAQDWRPFPRRADRAGWLGLPGQARAELLAAGEAALAEPVPFLPATLYLEYRRVGNRSRFEALHRRRRELLHALVLAECVEAQGRFLDALVNCLWAICEESTWCYPAHVGVQKVGPGLPEITEPIVDLFAGETAVSLAWTTYLLGAQLDEVSPRLRPRIDNEIRRRILEPFRARDDFGWMGFGAGWPGNRPNNWNPWINASVLTTVLVVEADPSRRAELVHKCLRSLDRFVQPYPSDGGCDEGPGYWGHAGGSLMDCLELLHSASGGRIDFFRVPLIREIARYVLRAHIEGEWYVPVGDCGARLRIDRGLVFRSGARTGDAELQALAAYGATVSNVLESAGGRYLGRQLGALFSLPELLALRPAGPPLLRDVWLGSDDNQLMTARARAGSSSGLFVAAWGAHNAQSHNHNDVGNFLVFADGQPVFVDVGAPTYTAQTFSSRRYELWPMQSAYHNLPTINGAQQAAGRQASARAVHYSADDATATLTLDLASAYPPAAQVHSWVRTVCLHRGQRVEVTDAFELGGLAGDTSQNLLTPLEVEPAGEGVLRLRNRAAADLKPLRLRLEYDGARLEPRVERIELEDERLAAVWGNHLNRIILRARIPTTRGGWTLRVLPERSDGG